MTAHSPGIANPFVMGPTHSQPTGTGFGSVQPVSAIGQFGVVPASSQMGIVTDQAWNVQHPNALTQVPAQQWNAPWGQPVTANPFMVRNFYILLVLYMYMLELVVTLKLFFVAALKTRYNLC